MPEGMNNGNTDNTNLTQVVSIGSQDHAQRADAILLSGFSHGGIGYHGAREISDEFIRKYGSEKYEEFLQKIIWASSSVIEFDDFIDFPSIRNNFYLFFYPNFLGDKHRSQYIYARFAIENPDINRELLGIYKNRGQFFLEEPNELELLYNAYLIMQKYPEVSTNYDLFK